MPQNIGQAYVQIVPSSDGISGSIEKVLSGEAASAGKATGSVLASGIGSALLGGTAVVAAGVTAVSGAVVKGVTDLGAYGDNIDKMSQKMGISAEAYQEWDAVLQHSGSSIEAMKPAFKNLATLATNNAAAFEALGISEEQVASMSTEELFAATISGLQGMGEGAERTALATELLGRAGMDMGALLNTSAAETQAMRDRVHELGGVMSDEAIKNAAAFQDNLQDLQTAIGSIGRGLAAELLPGVNDVLAGFTSLVAGEEGATVQISAGFSSLFTNLSGIISQIVSTMSTMMPQIVNTIVEVLPQVVSMGVQLVVSLASALVQAAPQLLSAVMQILSDTLSQLSSALTASAPTVGTGGVNDFITGIMSALPEVISQGMEIITNLITGLTNAMPGLITGAGEAISTFIGSLMEALPQILESGTQMLLSIVQGIVENLPQIVTAVVQVISMLTQTIVTHLPEILQSGIKILLELLAGLIQAIPDLVAGIPQIIQSIVNTFGDFDWSEIGHNIMEGIKNGILSKIDSVIEAAKSGAQRVLDAAKGFLQIGSPSRVFAREVGRWIPEGIAVGIRENMDSVTDEMRKAADLTEMAYQSALSVSAPELSAASSDTNATLALILQMLMQYFPEFEQNKGLNGTDIYNIVNRQMGMAVIS